MPRNFANEKRPSRVPYGILAKDVLEKLKKTESAQTSARLGSPIFIVTDPTTELRQSEGSSDYSIIIRNAYRKILGEYLLDTAHDWAKLLEVAVGSTTETANAKKFQRLMESWKAGIGPTSSVTQMALQPAYQQIIGMGKEAIPFILRELEKAPEHWFWALKAITGIDPVSEVSRGNIEEMTRAWLAWGQKEGHIS